MRKKKMPLVFLDPLTDFGFKLLFGIPGSKPHLIDFINAFDFSPYMIVDIRFVEREQLGLTADDRKAVFDIHCIDEKGNIYVIELQRLLQDYFVDRSLFYSSFIIQSQAAKGKWNYQLHDMITIGILEFCFNKDRWEHWLSRVNLIDTDTGEVFTDRLRFVFIELPKFKKKEAELTSRLEWWIFLLKNLSKLKEIPLPLREDKIFKSFFMTARMANLSRKAYMEYVESQKNKWDLYSIKQTAESKASEKTVLKVAKAMKANGASVDFIAKTTGLTEAEINKL